MTQVQSPELKVEGDNQKDVCWPFHPCLVMCVPEHTYIHTHVHIIHTKERIACTHTEIYTRTGTDTDTNISSGTHSCTHNTHTHTSIHRTNTQADITHRHTNRYT